MLLTNPFTSNVWAGFPSTAGSLYHRFACYLLLLIGFFYYHMQLWLKLSLFYTIPKKIVKYFFYILWRGVRLLVYVRIIRLVGWGIEKEKTTRKNS